jgi:hypothetical protein
MTTPQYIVDKILGGEWSRAEAIVAVAKYANLHPAREIEEAFRPFVEACQRFEATRQEVDAFIRAFHPISLADISRAAAIELGPTPAEGGRENG